MKKLFIFLLAYLGLAWPVSAQNPKVEVRGAIRSTTGEPVKGVAVSDGYTVVVTDVNGEYCFNRALEAEYVFCSLPAEYAVPLRQGAPCFFKKLSDGGRYDFVLRPLKKGAERNFTLFCIADPQCYTIHHVNRFRTETVPDVKASAAKQKYPCYGVSLGDIAYTEKKHNATYVLPLMKNEMAKENIGMPVFQTIGNHDNEYQPMALNEGNPTPTIRYQRTFEAVFGPIDYSWNRGDAHIVTMNNVMYHTLETSGKYHGDFSDAQVEWLRQDLALVPKDKLLIFCVHIPLAGILDNANVQRVLALLGEFENCHIMSGHTHYNRNFRHANGIYEHIHGAASGGWWWSRNNGDGTPNGYAIYDIRGNKIVDWRYKSVGFDIKHQMRLYRGDAEFGGKYERLKLPFGNNVLLANVWNADKDWRIEVYEDGVLSGEMTLMEPSPYRGDEYPSLSSSKDWWAIGYHVGVVGRGHFKGSTRKNYCAPCYHMYTYTLKNPSAKVRVVAIDSHGRKYTETHVVAGAEYEDAVPPKYSVGEAW